jgi:hypothetical protein
MLPSAMPPSAVLTNGSSRVRAVLVGCGLALSLPCARVAAQAAPGAPGSNARPIASDTSGQHDFDFEFGVWKVHIRRLVRPLTGSTTWVEYDGTSVVRPVWDGRANLGELDVLGPAGRLQGMSLRLFNPQSRQWYIRWANARDGDLGVPMVGGFRNGRGEFYDQETFDGRSIFVRFIFSDVTQRAFRLEQAFSADGGKSWEPNWVATFTR